MIGGAAKRYMGNVFTETYRDLLAALQAYN
jgi:hypothetical protein